ncbi:MAG: response regulator [Desulfuromonadales bacterium]|nr:response regulator [Desulfuromonadales bacterium]
MATILLVDDVELFLALEKSFLLDEGHQVLTATSAEAALAQLEVGRPDLLLLDLYLPGINGDELCRQLRATEKLKTLPIIMVTAAGKEGELKRCLDAGCDDYVTKPISKQVLLEKVRRLLGKVKGRTAERCPVNLRVRLGDHATDGAARVRDISANGIFIKSTHPLERGSVVALNVELPDSEPLHLMGKVARVVPGEAGGMGIYFVHPDGAGRKILDEFLRRQDVTNPPTAHALPEPAMPAAPSATEEELHQRILELEKENQVFAEQLVTIEEVNNNLTNLYVASSKLHSVVKRDEVISIIKEIVINFVGSEKFALLLKGKQNGTLHYAAGEGFTPDDFTAVDQHQLVEVLASGESYYTEGPVVAGSDDPAAPLAAIPISIRGENIGVLAIYRLFVQKESFQPVDYQLFTMMAEHAASALFTSALYEESERKRETYKGFMDLLLKH